MSQLTVISWLERTELGRLLGLEFVTLKCEVEALTDTQQRIVCDPTAQLSL